MRAGRMPPVMPPAFAGLMRSDVAGGEVAFTAGADMEFVIGPEGGCMALYDVWRVWLYGCIGCMRCIA